MSTYAAEFVSHRFSTCELPERMRLPLWRENFGRAIVHADIQPLSSFPFRADATLQAIRGLRRIAVKGSPMRFKRLQASIDDGDDSIGLIVGSPSRVQLSQRGHDIVPRANDAIAILHSEPATVTYVDGFLLGLAVPRDALAQRVADVESRRSRTGQKRSGSSWLT